MKPNCNKPAASRFARIGWLHRIAAIWLVGWFLLVGAGPTYSADSTRNLADLSLEQLMNESVSSVSKREQKLSHAPAAVYVITQDDVQRSGATTIAEALRMAPGLSVAQLGSHDWIITARGFSEQYAGKLLVLIDGRAVYNPFYSGVNWDAQDVLLEDLDRIEVIRGPGATLWGANAVNGVINIITKKAAQTQGGLVVGGGGDAWYGGALRYGARIGDNAHYRVYAKYDGYDSLPAVGGGDLHDAWQKFQVGFRLDWEPWEANQITFQGDLYNSVLDGYGWQMSLDPAVSTFPEVDYEVGGGNLLGRWSHAFSEESELSLKAYYDRTSRAEGTVKMVKDTFDIEAQYHLTLGERNNVVLGTGYRADNLRYDGSFVFDALKPRLRADTFNAFVQDEITLVKDRLTLTLGSKFEHNEYTGFEIQPSGRILWTPNERHSVWGSIDRAVRTPNYVENHLRYNYLSTDLDGPGPTPPTLYSVFPGSDLESESLIAYELGYRVQATKDLFLDVATFYNDYDELITLDSTGILFEPSPAPPHFTVASARFNRMKGETYGIEIAPSWKVNDRWTLSGGYTWLKMNLHSRSVGRYGEFLEGDSPQNQFNVRSHLVLPCHLTFDTSVYYVDRLPNQNISSYVRLDLQVGWRPTKNLLLSAGVRDLLDDHHPEFRSNLAAPAQARRSFFGKLSWTF